MFIPAWLLWAMFFVGLAVIIAVLGIDLYAWWGSLKRAAEKAESDRRWWTDEAVRHATGETRWREECEQANRDRDYYRSLVIRCGEAMGPEAKTTDAGDFVPDVLCAKVPELVERMAKRVRGG